MINWIKYRLKILVELLPFANGLKRFFLLSMIMSVMTMASGFILPLFYKLFIDEVILHGDFSVMITVAAGYLGLFFAGVIFGYVKNYANYNLVNTILIRVKLRILKNYLIMPFPSYETKNIGDMKMRLDDDTQQINNIADAQSINYMISYITIFVSMGFLIVIDWRLAVFSITAIPLTFWLDNKIGGHEKMLNNTNRVNEQNTSSWLHASVQGWREIKALNLRRTQNRQYLRYRHKTALYYAKWINYWTARSLVIPKIKDEFFMRFGLYFVGGILILWGDLKISDLLVFAMYYTMLSGAVRTVSSSDADLQAAMPFTERLMESLIDTEGYEGNGVIPLNDNGTICLKNVYFSYPNTEKFVLYDFSTVIQKGERVAVTGKSGSGKTTVLKLITGMIVPVDGSVSYSGIDLRNIDLSIMHNRIGFVMQENLLFNTTLRENLYYGKDDATDNELREACAKAYILEFIDSLPDGFDTMIGEKGIKLSGGQRQRFVLARLFLRNVDVFIFDEATSALDEYSESIVHDAIRDIAVDKTIIIVSHRDSSIRLCDRRIVL